MGHGVQSDRRTTVLEIDIVGTVCPILVATRDVEPDVIAAQEIGRLHQTVQFDPAGLERVLGRSEIGTAVPPPTHRIHAQIDLRWVVQAWDREAVEATSGGQLEVDVAGAGKSGLKFQRCPRALGTGVAQVGLERVDATPLERVCPSGCEKFVFARIHLVEHVQRADAV